MIACDALIVGGGPAGSTCARALGRAGWDVVIADRAAFPRDKVCAGWLTPAVFPLLELTPETYAAAGLTLQSIAGFQTGVLGGSLKQDPPYGRMIRTDYPRVISYAIRRYEFDDFLLRRAAVRVLHGRSIDALRRDGDSWIADDAIRSRVVIGAGGHFCPVARHLRGGAADRLQPVVAREAEAAIDDEDSNIDPEVPALFFCRDLEGYGWCVRKGGYVNVGIGRRDKRDFNAHVDSFTAFLERTGSLRNASRLRWRGHAYLAAGTGPRRLADDGLMVVGDAAGLAYPESGEGIRPAIESGRLAAEVLIGAAGRVDREALRRYDTTVRRLYPPAATTPAALRGAVTSLGRTLMRSRTFTRRVVLDRWFLRTVA